MMHCLFCAHKPLERDWIFQSRGKYYVERIFFWFWWNFKKIFADLTQVRNLQYISYPFNMTFRIFPTFLSARIRDGINNCVNGVRVIISHHGSPLRYLFYCSPPSFTVSHAATSLFHYDVESDLIMDPTCSIASSCPKHILQKTYVSRKESNATERYHVD